MYNKYSIIFNNINLNKIILFSEDAQSIIDASMFGRFYRPLPYKSIKNFMKIYKSEEKKNC